MKLKINKQILGYTLYGLLILIALLYFRFPGDAIVHYVVSTLSERNPNVLLSIGSIKPIIPPGLKANNLTLGFKNETSIIQADSLAVRPVLFSLLKGEKAIIFDAHTYGGTVHGRLNLAEQTSGKGTLNTEINIDGLTIDKCSYLRDTLGRKITGQLQGSLTSDGRSEGFAESTGNINFTILNGTYQLLEGLFGFHTLDFNKIEGQISFKGGMLKIEKLKMMGEKVRCSLRGNIILNSNTIKSSPLNILCDVEISGQINNKVSILVGGTLGKPTTKII